MVRPGVASVAKSSPFTPILVDFLTLRNQASREGKRKYLSPGPVPHNKLAFAQRIKLVSSKHGYPSEELAESLEMLYGRQNANGAAAIRARDMTRSRGLHLRDRVFSGRTVKLSK